MARAPYGATLTAGARAGLTALLVLMAVAPLVLPSTVATLPTVIVGAVAVIALVQRGRAAETPSTIRPVMRWWAAGAAAYPVAALVVQALRGAEPSAGVTDIGSSAHAHGYAVSVVLIAIAAVRIPRAGGGRRRMRAVVDTSAAATAFAWIVWQALVILDYGTPSVAGIGPATVLVGAATAVTGTVVVWMLGHDADESGIAAPVVWWLSAGTVATAVAQWLVIGALDSAWAVRVALMLTAVGAGCLVAAAMRDPEPRHDLAVREVLLRQRVAVLAPLLPLAIAAGVLGAWTLQGRSMPPAMVAVSFVLLLVLAGSTVLARLDSLDVAATLEDRVAERTLELGTREQWFRGLVQHSSDVITVVDSDATIRYQTPSGEHVLGHDPHLLVGQRLTGLLRPDDSERLVAVLAECAAAPGGSRTLDLPVWHRDGHWCDTETTVTNLLHDPRIQGIVLNTRDVSEQRRLQERLEHQAYSDGLTGLVNRARFREQVESALATAEAGTVAVVFLDLNGFKAVNDSQGHATGDRLLDLVGRRLRNCVRPGDVVARLGGDEFAVLVVGDGAEAGAMWVADRIRRVLAPEFVLEQRSVRLGAAIGLAVNDEGCENADQLLRNADLAMYRAKTAQRTEFLRFEASMHADLVARVDAEKDLHRAVDRGDLRLHYQPLVDLSTGDIVGAEALARWHHPERGLVSPAEFIELAEETGLVERIGAWALGAATTAAASWQAFAPVGVPFRVAVNVSARQVNAALPRAVRDALVSAGLPPSALTLEMTESALMERPDEAAAILGRLKTVGVRIAVDDFGTGYSSLSYLARFPVDALKIDRSFIENVDRRSDSTELVRTIVNLGSSMHLITVAEGIETESQRDAVAAMGCTLGQGYLFARAMSYAEMTAHLERAVLART